MKNKNDMVEQKSGLTTQNIQSIIKGRTRQSKAMPLIIEVANMRREVARRVARDMKRMVADTGLSYHVVQSTLDCRRVPNYERNLKLEVLKKWVEKKEAAMVLAMKS